MSTAAPPSFRTKLDRKVTGTVVVVGLFAMAACAAALAFAGSAPAWLIFSAATLLAVLAGGRTLARVTPGPEATADSEAKLEEQSRVLEARVVERTRALSDQNREMRLLLDNAGQAFLRLAADGRLVQEISAGAQRWFGGCAADTSFVEYMTEVDPRYADAFALAFDALAEGVMPRELCLLQMPARIRQDVREFRATYFLLGEGEQMGGLLVVVTDVTAEVRAGRYQAERVEFLAMFEAFSRDRSGLLAFVDETNEQLLALRSAPLDHRRRLLHTLKGNCSLMGMAVVADLCHQMEDELDHLPPPASLASLLPLERRWQELLLALRTFLGEVDRSLVEVSLEELESLELELGHGGTLARARQRVASWRLEPAERPLARLADHARALAARLGKGDLDVVIDAGGVRLPAKPWMPAWSELVHVVRNAVDHGIESIPIRRQAGKPIPAQLRLSTRLLAGSLIIEIADDGAGIDWMALKRAAIRRGLPHETEDDLLAALFAPQVSTSRQVTATSGRGVGLAAVHAHVLSVGGSLSVNSRPGEGTCFRFSFPTLDRGAPFADLETEEKDGSGRELVTGGRGAVA